MAKAKIAYVCSECGAHSVKWAGQCPDCNAWNTLTETSVGPTRSTGDAPKATTLAELPDDVDHRLETGFTELDRVLGGGLVEAMEDLMVGTVNKVARESVMHAYKDRFKVVAAKLGDDAGVLGAAAWARQKLA